MRMLGFMLASLSLTACQHTTSIYEAKQTVASSVSHPSEYLLISPKRVACQTALPMQCLQIEKTDPKIIENLQTNDLHTKSINLASLMTVNHEQQIAYDAIEGFLAKPNVGYLIEVQPIQTQPTKWKLISILATY